LQCRIDGSSGGPKLPLFLFLRGGGGGCASPSSIERLRCRVRCQGLGGGRRLCAIARERERKLLLLHLSSHQNQLSLLRISAIFVALGFVVGFRRNLDTFGGGMRFFSGVKVEHEVKCSAWGGGRGGEGEAEGGGGRGGGGEVTGNHDEHESVSCQAEGAGRSGDGSVEKREHISDEESSSRGKFSLSFGFSAFWWLPSLRFSLEPFFFFFLLICVFWQWWRSGPSFSSFLPSCCFVSLGFVPVVVLRKTGRPLVSKAGCQETCREVRFPSAVTAASLLSFCHFGLPLRFATCLTLWNFCMAAFCLLCIWEHNRYSISVVRKLKTQPPCFVFVPLFSLSSIKVFSCAMLVSLSVSWIYGQSFCPKQNFERCAGMFLQFEGF
jgi:hypothetical protein